MSCVGHCKHSKGLEFFSDVFVLKFSLWRGGSTFLLLYKVLKSFSKISKAVLRHDRNMFQVNVSLSYINNFSGNKTNMTDEHLNCYRENCVYSQIISCGSLVISVFFPLLEVE